MSVCEYINKCEFLQRALRYFSILGDFEMIADEQQWKCT